MYANIKIITAKERCDSKAYVDGPISPSVEGEDTALKLFTRKDWRLRNLDIWCKSDYGAGETIPSLRIQPVLHGFGRQGHFKLIHIMSRMYAILCQSSAPRGFS